MATIALTQLPNRGRQMVFSAPAQMTTPGAIRPPHPQISTKEIMALKPGVRGYVPVGTDTQTPGFVQDKSRASNNMQRRAT